MKDAKKPDRITSELLETAHALSKNNVLSAQDLRQVLGFTDLEQQTHQSKSNKKANAAQSMDSN